MNLSEMREILTARGIRLTRSLGQNFLHDRNQLERMVAAAALRPTDRVLEIGPGLGTLTERLLAEAGEVCAIETSVVSLQQPAEVAITRGRCAGFVSFGRHFPGRL